MKIQDRSDQTRSHILEAASECFSLYGYDETGVAEICKRAGVSKGAMYHHFSSKHAIFAELFENWMAELRKQMDNICSSAASVPEAIQSMVTMPGQVLASAQGQLSLFLEFLTKAAREPDIWKVTTAPYKQFRDFFTGLIRAGIQEGSLQSVNPETLSKIIVSFGVGLVIQGVFDPKGGDWKQVGKEGINMLLEKIICEGKS